MPERDGLTGLTTAQMIARDQAQQAEGSAWVGWLIVGAMIVWCVVRVIQEGLGRRRK